MELNDYLREEAARYRQLAEQAEAAALKDEFFDLADLCEEVASDIEDHLTGG